MVEMNSGLAIDAQGIARRFGARWVLRGVTLQVKPGEVVGLLGANGSGKSTLLRILATLLSASAGEAKVGGADIKQDPDGVRNQIGYLAHAAGLYDDLSARENLAFAAEMHGLRSPNLDAALARVGLSHVADERVRGFSAGMQRRLALARLVLGTPRVLLLDEPYSNLDTAGIALMNALIGESVRGGGAALVVLHELAPAVGILDRTIGIRDGRVATEASVEASLVAAAAAGGR
jgi:heme exporter protein A